MAGKILKKNKGDETKRITFSELKDTLPLENMLTVLSVFYLLCLGAVVLIKSLDQSHFWLWMAMVGTFVFILLWFIFQILTLHQRKKKALLSRREDAKALAAQLEECRDCSLRKIRNGLEYRKIYLNEDLRKIEKQLDQDAKALIYTSDLSTVIRRLDIIKENIKKGVSYRVVYFRNTTGDKFEEIKRIFGSGLISAFDIEEINSSIDAEMMTLSDTEIIVFMDGLKKSVQAFFSLDNISVNAVEVGRNVHDSECREKCNYGKEMQEPSYKELNDEKARTLYDDIESFVKGGEHHD